MYTTLLCLSRQICIQNFARKNAKTLHQNTGQNLAAGPTKAELHLHNQSVSNDETNSNHALKRKTPLFAQTHEKSTLGKHLTQSVLVSGYRVGGRPMKKDEKEEFL